MTEGSQPILRSAEDLPDSNSLHLLTCRLINGGNRAQRAVCSPEMMLTGVRVGFQRLMRGNQQGITETSLSPGMTSWESMRASTARHPTFQRRKQFDFLWD